MGAHCAAANWKMLISWQFWCLSIGHLLPRSTRRQRWRTTTSTWPSTSCSRSATSTPYDSNLILVKNNRTTVMVSRSTTTYSQNWTQTSTSRSRLLSLFFIRIMIFAIVIILIIVSVIVIILILYMFHLFVIRRFGGREKLLFSSFSSWPKSIHLYCHFYDPDNGQRSLSLSMTCWGPVHQVLGNMKHCILATDLALFFPNKVLRFSLRRDRDLS